MNYTKIDGNVSFSGGSYETLIINGNIKCAGDISAVDMDIDGVFRADGSIDCSETMNCNGISRINGSVTGNNVNIAGTVVVENGNIRASRLLVEGVFKFERCQKIEAGEIICKGFIETDGEISSDSINAEGIIRAREIVGDSVSIITRHYGSWGGFIFGSRRSYVKLIEATDIKLRKVRSDLVSGSNIRIEKGCKIKKVDCNGALYIHPGAKVGEITGNYTMSDNSTTTA